LGIAAGVFPYRERFFFATGVKEGKHGAAGLIAVFSLGALRLFGIEPVTGKLA